MTTEDLVNKSLEYERAYGKVSDLLLWVREQRNLDDRCSRISGDDSDASWGILIKELERLKGKYRHYSDELWAGAEKKGAFQKDAIKDLLSAVVLRAANDYELAVSGEGNAEEMSRIEWFAQNDATGFTGIFLPDVLKKIREAQPKFAQVARENIKEIVDESELNRKNRKADMSQNKHRCPLCGGGLFTQTRRGSAYQVVCCSGCSLREVVPMPKKNGRSQR